MASNYTVIGGIDPLLVREVLDGRWVTNKSWFNGRCDGCGSNIHTNYPGESIKCPGCGETVKTRLA